MTDEQNKQKTPDGGKFVIDGTYFLGQAREAIKTFTSPYTRIYRLLDL